MANAYKALSSELAIYKVVCFSDSQVSLAWIQSEKKEFNTFVQNRVKRIRENVKGDCWNYCKSEDNPANILTQNKSNDLSQWLTGP